MARARTAYTVPGVRLINAIPLVLGKMTAFQTGMTAAAQGGPKDTAAKNEARDALVSALRQIAAYIQSLGLTNMSDVLTSGFDVVMPHGNTPTPLTTPMITPDNSESTKLKVGLWAVPHAKAYQLQCSTDGGKMWSEAGNSVVRSAIFTGRLGNSVLFLKHAITRIAKLFSWSSL